MLVYTSKATQPPTTEALARILAASYRLNKRDGITGFLISRSNHYLQLLEGPEQAVRACYARIKADSRHKDILLRGEAFTPDRCMPNWTMGLVDAGKSAPSIQKLFANFDSLQAGTASQNSVTLLKMVCEFSEKAVIMELTELVC